MVKYTFRGKRVLLTGACGGLGSALTKELARRDASLVLSGRSADKLYALIRELPNETSVLPIPADLSLPGEARKLALKAIEAVGTIDILINNAGIGYHALMEETSDDKIRHLYEVNTYSPMALIKAILPKMKAQRTGRIVNIVSCTGHVPIPTTGVYGASKSALAKMAAVMRLELAPFGIDITNIYPGPVNTDFDKNTLRENGRIGLSPAGALGVDPDVIAKRIIDTACGPPGEIWIDRRSKWKMLASMIWLKLADRVLSPLRNKVLIHSDRNGHAMKRRWRLRQLESSVACDLNCIMSPWKKIRHRKIRRAIYPLVSGKRFVLIFQKSNPSILPVVESRCCNPC
jgi:short-subunit dehydrogenase